MNRPILSRLTLFLSAILLGGCGQVEVVREYFREPTPHEEYFLSLSHAGLSATALGKDWVQASEDAIYHPLRMDAPYREEGFFPAEEPSAFGYRFPLRRGQRLVVTVDLVSSGPTRLFVDLFRAAPDSSRAPVPVLSGEAGTEMVFEPRRTGDYLLRIQPELLRDGQFTVTIEKEPSMVFPVVGRTSRSIQSFFGDSRDAGRREHHGVDVFAPRGTPVVASAEAYVSRVDTTPVGGRVIWLRDSRRGTSIYYAHLHELLVREGTRVNPGDTIGLVGNTGNARTTPPHLHFGLYIRGEGAFDPWDFLVELPTEIEPVEVELAELGEWVRIAGHGQEIHLRDRPTRRSQVLTELPQHTALRVLGGVGTWYRVRLPDGSRGFVASRLTEDLENPIRLERLVESQSLQAQPRPDAPVMDELPEGVEVPVLGTFGDFLFVQSPSGRAGWMAQSR
jgi:murein DD-endopeptidase MepM/ murein hydrolase activator NlpD/SH3-like domain-containing protein